MTYEDLLAYKNYIEDNLERIERGGWTPVCFDEFVMSEERETVGPKPRVQVGEIVATVYAVALQVVDRLVSAKEYREPPVVARFTYRVAMIRCKNKVRPVIFHNFGALHCATRVSFRRNHRF